MKSRKLLAILIAVLFPALLFAQGGPSMILEFVSGSELTVQTPNGTTLAYPSGIAEDDAIPVGSLVKTGPTTTAELRLKPNGTLVKLAKGTNFRVDTVAAAPSQTNQFALLGGKVRTVAAKGGSYEIRSTSTVAGVRGTDFTFAVEEGKKNLLLVAKGAVQFGRLAADGAVLESILVGAGQFADLFGSAFQALAYTPEQFAAEYGDVEIEPDKLKSVPGQDLADAGGDTKGEDQEKAVEKKEPAEDSPFVKWLKEALGFELGSVTIDQTTYAKAVIQPIIKVGKLKMGLYLPVIYQSNLFDPGDWYRPRGNDEWSFGTDVGWRSDPAGAALDAAQDLALKIRFLEYGRQLEDPFYLKVGNLNTMTLGHGLLMRNYANDQDFPAVRRIGLNMGVTGEKTGFEVVTNDLADPSVVGARLFFFPVKDFPFSLGAQAVADFFPARELAAPSGVGDPIFLGLGVDMDLPIIRRNALLGIRWFAEGAATVPYIRDSFTDGSTTVDPGLKTELLWSDNQLKNWGAATGFIGNVAIIDWRLEFRYFTGAFRPAFFDSAYERVKGTYAEEYANYLLNPGDYDATPNVMGVYGEGGFSFLREKLTFKMGYFWPWSPDAASLASQIANEDYFVAQLVIKKGLIPIVDVYGSVAYEKRGLAKDLFFDNDFSILDANTTLKGEIVVPVPKTPNLDLAFVFSTSARRDGNGNIVYASAGIPEMVPVITLETRLHF